MEDHIGYSLGDDDIKKEETDLEIKMEAPRIADVSRLQCHVCYKIMGHRSSLYKHLKYVHKIEPAHRLPISCREKDCYQSFTFIDPFRRHLAEQHGFNIVVEKYFFQSMAEFFSWKKVTEEQENLRFIVSTGPRNSRGGKTHYYRCQKNGAYKPEIKKRLQSDNRESVYNISTTHCISSMFVFEEPKRVSVEFCRTHYGHDVSSKAIKPKIDNYEETYSTTTIDENNLNYEIIDSQSKLDAFLSEKDKAALVSILSENENLLEQKEGLFYDNEQDIIFKIPYNILKSLMKGEEELEEEVEGEEEEEEEDRNTEKSVQEDMDNSITVETVHTINTEDNLSGDETGMEKFISEEIDNENSTILKSLGNGVFLDTSSNKRLKLDSFIKKTKCKDTSNENESSRNDKEKNTVLVKEYLNEFDEKVYVLELIKEEDTIIQKRKKILSQLQKILVMVNSEDDVEVLDDIQNHLSKYANPE